MPTELATELGRLLDRPEEQVDLARAGLLLARAEYPDLDVEAELARFDALAAQAAPFVSPQPAGAPRVNGLRAYLAEVSGFRGNQDDYDDPRNSFLHEVLDRRTGLPITLSVVYMEVGRRLGVSLSGIGLPGHFVVQYRDRQNLFFLDPFSQGRILSGADCRGLVERLYQGRVPFQEEFLAPVDKRYIIRRMLHNLRGVYLRREELEKTLRILDLILAVAPDSPEDLKQRGLVHYRLRQYRRARLDLESYLARNPPAPQAEPARKALRELKRVAALLN